MYLTQTPLLAFYGDDFTGSTDALEFLNLAGIKAVLFIDVPSAEQLARFPEMQAIGVAGMTRAMNPKAMERELDKAFRALKDLGIRHVHYKVCSTFDSSPQIGSIGKAAEIGKKIFNASFIPLLVAAPPLGRYCLFGNLFARLGIGSQGEIHRLDRHPAISHHPVTPMQEADLRLHLSKQTKLNIGLVDILSIHKGRSAIEVKIGECLHKGDHIILFDALHLTDLVPIGEVLDNFAVQTASLFSIGSSGIEMAFGAQWKNRKAVDQQIEWPQIRAVTKLLVLSGSCSPVTAGQINYALRHGFKAVAISAAIFDPNIDLETRINEYLQQIFVYLEAGSPVILHTSLGPHDARIRETKQQLLAQGYPEEEIGIQSAQLHGQVFGAIAARLAQTIGLDRLVIAGGDTSSLVARALGIEAVEMIAPFSPGAPLCRAHARGAAIDGVELNFKGGQVGDEHYFINLWGSKAS